MQGTKFHFQKCQYLWKNKKESDDKKGEREYTFIEDNIGKMVFITIINNSTPPYTMR